MDYSEGGPVSSEAGQPGRSGPRREASAIRKGRRPDGEAREGSARGGFARRDGSQGRFRGAGARRALGRWAEGQVSVARRAFPRGRCLGVAGNRDAGKGRRDSGSSERCSGTRRGVRLTNPDATPFGARRRRANLRETPVGDETSGAAQSDPHNGSRRPPRASGSSGNGRSRRGGMLMRSASGARDRGWSFTAYSLDPEASGNVSAGHVAPTPRSRP